MVVVQIISVFGVLALLSIVQNIAVAALPSNETGIYYFDTKDNAVGVKLGDTCYVTKISSATAVTLHQPSELEKFEFHMLELITLHQSHHSKSTSQQLFSISRIIGAACLKATNLYIIADPQHTLLNIVDQCNPNPCHNGAFCHDLFNYYICHCAAGYTGKHCKTDINECSPNPCYNGGVCIDLVSDFKCQCAFGYTGKVCEIGSGVVKCSSNPCDHGGACTDIHNDYKCQCLTGYTGKSCQKDINDCNSNPCKNGGICTDLVNGHTCDCVTGYTGKNCETGKLIKYTQNIDDCASNRCRNGATCTDHVNDYTCHCAAGYKGRNCETDIDDCVPNRCQNGAICTDLVNGYTCQCSAGYTGKSCETDINDCNPNPCKNGGVCTDLVGDYKCQCAVGYTGKNCETASGARDCYEIQQRGAHTSGVYRIYPQGVVGGVDVFCDMDTDGGGWLVFQKRFDGTLSFEQVWSRYKSGFGDASAEFWLGNSLLHTILSQTDYSLRIDMEKGGTKKFAMYDRFLIESESTKFQLVISGFFGDAGDYLSSMNNKAFSTMDQDNDGFSSKNCAADYGGGWWYHSSCGSAYLNGPYQTTVGHKLGIYWGGFTQGITKIELKIKPRYRQ